MAELAAVDRIDGEWVIAIGSAAEFTVHRVREREALKERLDGAPTVVVTAEAQEEFSAATGRTSDLEAISRLEAVYRSVRKEDVAGKPCLVLFLEALSGSIGLVDEDGLESKHAADPALTPRALFQECAKRSPSFAYWLGLKKDNQPEREEAFRNFLDNLLSGDAARPVGATRWMRRIMQLDAGLSRDAFRRMRRVVDPQERARLLVLAGWAGAAHWNLGRLLESENLEILARSGKAAFDCGPRGLVEYAKETMKPPVDTAKFRAELARWREALVMKAGVAAGEVIPQLPLEVRPRHRKTVAEYLNLKEEAGQLDKRLGQTPVAQTLEGELKALGKRVEDLSSRHKPDTFFELLDAGHACGAAARGDLLKALTIQDCVITEGASVSNPAEFEVIGEAPKGPSLEIEKMVAPGYADASGRVIRRPRVVLRAWSPAVRIGPAQAPPKSVKRSKAGWWKPFFAALTAGGVVLAAIALWRMAGQSEPSLARGLELGAKVLKTSLAAGGGSLLTVLEGNQARLLEVWRTADWSRMSAGLASTSPAAAISPDGLLLATGSQDRNLPALWNSKTGSPLGQMEPATARHGDTVRALVFSHYGSYLISGADDGVAKLWNVRTRRFVRELPLHSPVTALAVGSKGLVAAGIWDKAVSVWEQEASQISQTLEGAPDRITDVAVSPDESLVAAASVDQVLLWRLGGGGQPLAVKPLNANATAVAFSPDGKLLAAGAGNSIWIWDLSGGGMEPRKPLNAHSAPVTSLVFLPRLSPISLVSGSEDKSLKIWEIP